MQSIFRRGWWLGRGLFFGGFAACSDSLTCVHKPDLWFCDRPGPFAILYCQDTSRAGRFGSVAFDPSSFACQACTRSCIVGHCASAGIERRQANYRAVDYVSLPPRDPATHDRWSAGNATEQKIGEALVQLYITPLSRVNKAIELADARGNAS